MAVQEARTADGAGSDTWASLRTDHTGRRLIVLLGDRAGGVTASVGTNQPELEDLGEPIAQRVAVAGGNKTVFLFTAVIPTFANNPILASEVLDSGESAVVHQRVAIVVDEAGNYELAEVADADSGSSTVSSQVTGETASVAAGDLLIIAGDFTRGRSTRAWSSTSHTPDNPGGGTWDLLIEQSGNANNARSLSMGYASLTGQAAQTWEDTDTYGTSRESSALIAVWATAAAAGVALGTHAIQVTHQPLTVTADGSVTVDLASHAVDVTHQPLTVTADGAATVTLAAHAVELTHQPLTVQGDAGTITLGTHSVDVTHQPLSVTADGAAAVTLGSHQIDVTHQPLTIQGGQATVTLEPHTVEITHQTLDVTAVGGAIVTLISHQVDVTHQPLTVTEGGAEITYVSVAVGPLRDPLLVDTMRDPLEVGAASGELITVGELRDTAPTIGDLRDEQSPTIGELRDPLTVDEMREPVTIDELRD